MESKLAKISETEEGWIERDAVQGETFHGWGE